MREGGSEHLGTERGKRKEHEEKRCVGLRHQRGKRGRTLGLGTQEIQGEPDLKPEEGLRALQLAE